MKLYEMSRAAQETLALLDDDEYETQEVFDILESVMGDFNNKALNVGAYIKNLIAETIAMRDYESKMRDRRHATERKIKNLKDYLCTQMLSLDIKKVSGCETTLCVRRNPPSVKIQNPDLLADSYFNVSVIKNPDKARLKEHLQSGIEIEGVSLEQTESILIK